MNAAFPWTGISFRPSPCDCVACNHLGNCLSPMTMTQIFKLGVNGIILCPTPKQSDHHIQPCFNSCALCLFNTVCSECVQNSCLFLRSCELTFIERFYQNSLHCMFLRLPLWLFNQKWSDLQLFQFQSLGPSLTLLLRLPPCPKKKGCSVCRSLTFCSACTWETIICATLHVLIDIFRTKLPIFAKFTP